MSKSFLPEAVSRIIEKVKSHGAALAGITNASSLQNSPSHKDFGNFRIPAGFKSVLVFALAHPEREPELDWWDGRGGTPGNRKMEVMAGELIKWLKAELGINARVLPYHVERGGIFLKDAAVLSGMGAIGANNLLVTPELGPRVRLRALVLDLEAISSLPADFAPCSSCDKPCQAACPEKAFRNSDYKRTLCMYRMKEDEASLAVQSERGKQAFSGACVKYCRACELACPVGKR